MHENARRIVVDSAFETTVGDLSRALREERLRVVARVDVRDHFWRELKQDFRRYALVEAWVPECAFEALRHNLDSGSMLPITFAVYELPDGETVIVVREPLSPLTGEADWRQQNPALAALAVRESERIARVLDRVQRRSSAAISAA